MSTSQATAKLPPIRTFRCGDIVPADWLRVRRERGAAAGRLGTPRFEQPAMAIQGRDGAISLHLLGDGTRAMSLRGYKRCLIQWAKQIKIIDRSGAIVGRLGETVQSSPVVALDGTNNISADDAANYF